MLARNSALSARATPQSRPSQCATDFVVSCGICELVRGASPAILKFRLSTVSEQQLDYLVAPSLGRDHKRGSVVVDQRTRVYVGSSFNKQSDNRLKSLPNGAYQRGGVSVGKITPFQLRSMVKQPAKDIRTVPAIPHRVV